MVMHLRQKNIVQAYKYASDLMNYAVGEIKVIVEEFCKELKCVLEDKVEITNQRNS